MELGKVIRNDLERSIDPEKTETGAYVEES
jgi:hypothetical protein